MQELTNDDYPDIKLYSIFHIEYKDIEFITNKKEPKMACPMHFCRGCFVIVSILKGGVKWKLNGHENIHSTASERTASFEEIFFFKTSRSFTRCREST